MKHLFAAMLAVTIFASPACARPWFVVNNEIAACENAEMLDPNLASPETFRLFVESQGDTTDIQKMYMNPDDSLAIQITVPEMSDKNVFVFYSSMQACQYGLNLMLQNGSVVSQDDMN